MDGIQKYDGPGRNPVAVVHHSAGPPPSAVKTPSNYVHAVRRRAWLALAVAIPVGMAGTLYVLRMPSVYAVTATIEIKPPSVDPSVRQLLAAGDVAANNAAADERYVPNTLAMLQSKSLLSEVVNDKALGLPPSAFDNGDPAAELMGKIKSRQIPLSQYFYISYEGRDPAQITKTLNLVLHHFRVRADQESRGASEGARDKASRTLDGYTRELAGYEEALADLIRKSSNLAPGGRNLKDSEYSMLRDRIFFDENRAKQIKSQAMIDSANPISAVNPAIAAKLENLEVERKSYDRRLTQARRASRDPSDPSITRALNEIRDIDDAKDRLLAQASQGGGITHEQAAEQVYADVLGDLTTTRNRLDAVLAEMKDGMPEYQRYTTLMADRDLKAKAISSLKEKLSAFSILADTQKEPVKIHDMAAEPTIPIKPSRPMLIAASILFGIGLGVALVCFLEHIDHSVKVPEHLTAGLAIPLFGVVPRMRRTSRNHRGGHLWTPGTPDSIEADAYRNLRASLLGVTDQSGPIVTLLVTSAKAGEGKSTTALNLAATCARAGERTLLMDVDLRRPSLNEVFPGKAGNVGLVDVLRGDLPWQRTVVQTDLPNLDFLPTGDTRDVPIEVLGSLELRQLLISLSENHYDRVILDGPAVLGLADCRMLGRVVDAAVMVVRSGSQEIRSLQRAKAMLEQSSVAIAGVIFNGLTDDLENWSSYGPSPIPDHSAGLGRPRGDAISRGLDDRSRPEDAGVLVAAEARA